MKWIDALIAAGISGWLYILVVLAWRMAIHQKPFDDRIGWIGLGAACISGAVIRLTFY